MIYCDTNIYLYAFLSKVDDEEQQTESITLLHNAIESKTLIISEINLYEYAFVAKKQKESQEELQKYLDFMRKFIQPSNDVYKRALDIMNQKDFYRHSFDVFHLAFAEHYHCDSLVTFDKGFKKLQDITKVEIIVL